MAHAQFNELEPFLPEAEEKMAELLCMLLEVPRSRLKMLKLFDGTAIEEGRTGMDFKFEPELTQVEEKKLQSMFRKLNTFLGASRPPIFMEKV